MFPPFHRKNNHTIKSLNCYYSPTRKINRLYTKKISHTQTTNPCQSLPKFGFPPFSKGPFFRCETRLRWRPPLQPLHVWHPATCDTLWRDSRVEIFFQASPRNEESRTSGIPESAVDGPTENFGGMTVEGGKPQKPKTSPELRYDWKTKGFFVICNFESIKLEVLWTELQDCSWNF